READVLRQRVQPMMQPFDRLGTGRDVLERLLELRQVLQLDDEVEFAEAGAEAELAAREAPVLDQAVRLEVPEIIPRRLDQRHIADAGLEVAPDVIEVHRAAPDSSRALRRRAPWDKRNVVIVGSTG